MIRVLRPKKLSKKGAEFVAAFEGFVDHPYNDAANNATIGFGHLLHKGPVTQADRNHWGKITRAQGLALLQKDAQIAADAVAKYAKPWRQSRFDALVSFTFNCGVGALATSTLLKKHRARDFKGAAREFKKWNRAGGRVLKGLSGRRAAEAKLYLSGRYE